ncbi:hypothetical protein PQQ64_20085 [Paraburkholderia graminis]|uniref:hypothetical protein n=1 Tax=Paraburkholderia graminis TaxID=60548 RepID=UPI0038BDF2BD
MSDVSSRPCSASRQTRHQAAALGTTYGPNDRDFETKAAGVIWLCLNPPVHAAVFCVDEETAIQALKRRDVMLPLSLGRAERHGFEYERNGTFSLSAAFNSVTGEVLGKTAPRRTSTTSLNSFNNYLAANMAVEV